MRGAGRAIGWDFLRRHRFWLAVLAVYVVAFWTVKGVLGPEARVRLHPPNDLAAFIVAPLGTAFIFILGIFSYGLGGDLAARESIFPSRLFTLPVSSAALAGWPMIYGATAGASLWLVSVLLARWPGGVDAHLPWIWPALWLAVSVTWMQALTWMSYGLRGLRVAVAVLWLATIDAIVLFAMYYAASERLMVAILAPQLPVAYLVGWHAVSQARRGEVPDWGLSFIGRGRGAPDRRLQRLSSPAGAQAWFEWRRHGRTLPVMVGIVVPCELLLLFAPGHDTAPMVFAILFLVAITPPFMAAFAAPALASSTLFEATRPISSISLVAAKLRMAMGSTLAAWLLVIVFGTAALWLSGAMQLVIERLRAFLDRAGAARGLAIVLLLLAALVASTWKNLVQSLCIGLTGRDWLIKSSLLVALAMLVALWPLMLALTRNDGFEAFVWEYFPWMLAALVVLKMSAACSVAARLHDRRLLPDRALLIGAVCWLGAVLALYGIFEWLLDSPIFPLYLVLGVAILEVPLVRLGASILALGWSRHR